jgi:hypothetical protein
VPSTPDGSDVEVVVAGGRDDGVGDLLGLLLRGRCGRALGAGGQLGDPGSLGGALEGRLALGGSLDLGLSALLGRLLALDLSVVLLLGGLLGGLDGLLALGLGGLLDVRGAAGDLGVELVDGLGQLGGGLDASTVGGLVLGGGERLLELVVCFLALGGEVGVDDVGELRVGLVHGNDSSVT